MGTICSRVFRLYRKSCASDCVIFSVVGASSRSAMEPIIFSVLKRKCGLIWLFKSSSRLALSRFSISLFSSFSCCRSSVIRWFSWIVWIFSSIACFISLKIDTSSPRSSRFSTQISSPEKSDLAMRCASWLSSRTGFAMDSFITFPISTTMTSIIRVKLIKINGSTRKSGSFSVYAVDPASTVSCSSRREYCSR